MNKLILFPLLILLVLSVISTAYGLEGVDTDSDVGTDVGGYFYRTEYNQIKWYNNNTGNSYFVVDLHGVSIDPREETDEPFKIANTDSGEYDYYDNYADFIKNGGKNAYIKAPIVPR